MHTSISSYLTALADKGRSRLTAKAALMPDEDNLLHAMQRATL
jgi:hypothetical protein